MTVIDLASARLAALRSAIRRAGSPSTKQLLIDVFADAEIRAAVLTGGPNGVPIDYMGRAALLASSSPAARQDERVALYCAALLVPIGEAFARSDRIELPVECRLEAREHLRLALRRPLARLEATSGQEAELVRVSIGLGDDELWGQHEAARLKTIVTVALAKAKLTPSNAITTPMTGERTRAKES